MLIPSGPRGGAGELTPSPGGTGRGPCLSLSIRKQENDPSRGGEGNGLYLKNMDIVKILVCGLCPTWLTLDVDYIDK